MKSLIQDLGFGVKVKVHSGACAAIGMARRRGLGRARPLDVEDLWVQSKVRDGHIDLLKVKGSENPADILTKYVSADVLQQMSQRINLKFLDGRRPAVPELTPDTISAILGREEARAAKDNSVPLAQGVFDPELAVPSAQGV